MIFGDKALFSFGYDGATRIILFEPRECGCGHEAYFVINRDGSSRCIECDSQYQQLKERFLCGLGSLLSLSDSSSLNSDSQSPPGSSSLGGSTEDTTMSSSGL